MKKIIILTFTLTILSALTLTAQSLGYLGFDISNRLQGINPALLFIIPDEYTDFMTVNPAYILDVNGKRVYTQLSNIQVGFDNYDLVLGAVTPFKNSGNIGGFLSADRTKDAVSIRYFDLDDASASAGIFNTYDETELRTTDWQWPYGRSRKGEYHYEESDNVNDTVERESGRAFNDKTSFQFNTILGLDTLPFGDTGVKLGYDRQVANDISYDYSYSYEDKNNEDNFLIQDYSGKTEEIISIISIAPSIRGIQLKSWDLGTTLELDFFNVNSEGEIDSDISLGSAHDDAYGGQTDTYERTFASDIQGDYSGTRMGIKINASRSLSETLNLKCLTGFRTMNLTGDAKIYQSDEVGETGGIGGIVEEWNKKQSVYRERTETEILALAGIEKEMPGGLLLGAGIGAGRLLSKNTVDEERALVIEDGTEKYSDVIEMETEEETNSAVILPVGIEWKATKWLRARFGADYTIVSVKETETVETKTFVSTDKDAEKEKVTTTKESDDDVELNIIYYSGIGIDFTDKLVVDLSGYSWGGNILNMDSWQVSATFKF